MKKTTKKHDRLSVRLAQILMRLNNHERLNMQALALEFGVNLRTIRRDLHERLSFMPIKKEGNDYFLEPFALGKVSVKDMKNFASLSGIKTLYPRLDEEFIIDLLDETRDQALIVHDMPCEKVNNDNFNQVKQAILDHKMLRFIYKDKERLIKPYKLISHKGIWYILGDEEGKLKHFAFNKASCMRADAQTFLPNKEFLKEIANSETVWLGMKKATLWVKQEAKEYFLRKPTWKHYEIMQNDEHGLRVCVSFSYDDEVLHFVKQWIPYIYIMEPLALKEKLHLMLKDYMQECEVLVL